MTTAREYVQLIERIGATAGRWPKYNLVVGGVDLGRVERVLSQGRNGIGRNECYDGWRAGGQVNETRERAERRLIGRQLTVWNPRLDEGVARRALRELDSNTESRLISVS